MTDQSKPIQGKPILTVMHELGIINSFGEGRRLINQGAVSVSDAKITGDEALVHQWDKVIKVGRREWLITAPQVEP